MRAFAGIGNLEVWYAQFDAAWVRGRFGADLSARGRERWAHAVDKARSHDTVQVFDKLTRVVDGERRITPDPPLITPLEDLLPDEGPGRLEQQISRLIERYGSTSGPTQPSASALLGCLRRSQSVGAVKQGRLGSSRPAAMASSNRAGYSGSVR
ncbi:hypothetical protein SLA_6029 [Streptomyces laurentii]|uniref:Uncharacterized protein n=1 Tax=Streptomyces laurentii TaxID=39478 RepID=A0A169P952_STRLU|nr:hypothetical protein SLA_6029 [Streptomyces laurentii]